MIPPNPSPKEQQDADRACALALGIMGALVGESSRIAISALHGVLMELAEDPEVRPMLLVSLRQTLADIEAMPPCDSSDEEQPS